MDFQTLLTAGNLFLKKNKPTQSIALFNRAIKLGTHPDDIRAHFNLGQVLLTMLCAQRFANNLHPMNLRRTINWKITPPLCSVLLA